MKKFLLLFSLLVFLGLMGCAKYETIDYKGISMKYPSDLTVSYNNFKQFNGENIDVEFSHIGDFMFDCSQEEIDRGIQGANYNEYQNTLKQLRDKGVNEAVKNLESLTCGFAGGNLSVKPMNIDGINGVVYHKVTGNSGLPSLSTFFTQVLLVGPENQVYSIVFNYEFGELGKYIGKIKDEFGEAILDDKDSRKYEEVMNYLKFGTPIRDTDVKKFEDNDAVINKMIKTIKLNK